MLEEESRKKLIMATKEINELKKREASFQVRYLYLINCVALLGAVHYAVAQMEKSRTVTHISLLDSLLAPYWIINHPLFLVTTNLLKFY